jgi:hypothetical protein
MRYVIKEDSFSTGDIAMGFHTNYTESKRKKFKTEGDGVNVKDLEKIKKENEEIKDLGIEVKDDKKIQVEFDDSGEAKIKTGDDEKN